MLGTRFDEALTYAHDCHRTQRRKGGEIPYVAHLMAVCSIVLEHGADEDVAIAALLHDAGEDAGGEARLADIERRFGADVARIVRGCSDSLEEDPTQKEDWEVRKKAYLRHLQGETDSAVLLVSAADKLHNARSTLADFRLHGAGLWSRFNAGVERQLWYYRSLVAVFRRKGQHAALVDELERVVEELHAAAHRPAPIEHEMKWRMDGGGEAGRLAAMLEGFAGPGVASAEDNRLLDAGGRLQARDEVLRIRMLGGRAGAVLTWKGAASYEGGLKSREELEVRVEDGPRMIDVLRRLGFEETVRYEKERHTWDAGEAEVALDRLVFGHFIEIEGPPERVAEVARDLGLSVDAVEPRGYPSLMREHLGRG